MKKRYFCLLLALLMLPTLLSGCSESEEDIEINRGEDLQEEDSLQEEEDIEVGGDWRTWKAYNYVTLNHDGGVDLVLDISAAGAMIYLDTEGQDLYDSVTFPYESIDEEITAGNLNVVDYNEDGYEDLFFTLAYDAGEDVCATEDCLYLWNPEACCFELASEDLEGLGGTEEELSYLESNGLSYDMTVYDDYEVALDDAFWIYSTDTDYTVLPAGVRFTVLSDLTEEDIRTLQVQKDVVIYAEDIPTLTGAYLYYGLFENYFDAWTGRTFSFGEADGSHNDYCEWIVNTGDAMFTVSCSRDIEWEQNVDRDGMWAICHTTYELEMPAFYTGFTLIQTPAYSARYEMEYFQDEESPEYLLDNEDNTRLLSGLFVNFN